MFGLVLYGRDYQHSDGGKSNTGSLMGEIPTLVSSLRQAPP